MQNHRSVPNQAIHLQLQKMLPLSHRRTWHRDRSVGQCRRGLRFSVTYVAETEADEDALMAETKRRQMTLVSW